MYNIYFEVAAVGFMGILLLYLYIEYPKASESNIRYRQWVTWILLSLIVDVVTTRMTDYGYMIPPFVNVLASTFYFIITAGSFWGLARYLHAIIKGKFSNVYMTIINSMVFIYTAIMIVNIFTGWIFTYDEAGSYLHGPYFPIIYIFQAICHTLSIVLLISYRKKLEKRLLISIWLFMLFIIAGYILQVVFFQKTLLVFYMFSLAAMTSLFVVETPDYSKLSEALKEVEEQKRRADVANKAKSEFIAKMSHEIRTPINAVIGMDEMILRDSKEAEIKGYAFDIKNAAEALLSTINDILDLSKVESGKMEIVPVDYDVSSMINDVSNMIEFRAKEKGLEFIVDIDENIPSRLKCILYISVKDTGMGIRKEDKEKLFEQYSRLDMEKNRNIEGTGLGMSITLQLLNLMNSNLKVNSVYGEGSEFYFYLTQPITNDTPIGSLQDRIKEQKSSYNYGVSFIAPKAKILLVDDNYMNRKVARSLLRDTLIRIDEAAGGYECIECVKDTHYDVILLDHMMPDLDGIKTFRMMRDNDMYKCKGTPVVALTANMIAGAKEMYEREGFDSFLGKPIRPERLEELLIELIPDELVEVIDNSKASEDVSNDASGADSNIKLPYVEGIDIENALLHLGNVSLVEDMIVDYTKQSKKDANKLEAYYKNITDDIDITDNLRQYMVLVHSMKNSAAMIGAITISELAKLLEYAARDERVDTLTHLHGVFIEENDKLIERIELSYADKINASDKAVDLDDNISNDNLSSDDISDVTYDADKPNKSVLVIDDSSSMLSSIKALLSEKYKVVIVPGGKQGVRYLSKKKPDIILLDYLMPEMDGVQTLEEIRKLPDCSDIPVLFLTGADDKSINDLSELNVQGVVKKPPVLEDLLKSIEEALR